VEVRDRISVRVTVPLLVRPPWWADLINDRCLRREGAFVVRLIGTFSGSVVVGGRSDRAAWGASVSVAAEAAGGTVRARALSMLDLWFADGHVERWLGPGPLSERHEPSRV
jgi:hypothetical protein